MAITKEVTHPKTGFVFTILPLTPKLMKEIRSEVRRLDGLETGLRIGNDGSRQISADAVEAFNYRAALKLTKKLSIPEGDAMKEQKPKDTEELIESSGVLIEWLVEQSSEFQKEREEAFKADEKN